MTRIGIAIALLALAFAAPAEEIDVLTLKSGRVLEGHYDAATKAFTFGGGIVGSVQIEPGEIVKQEKKLVTAAGAKPGEIKTADPAPADPKGDPKTSLAAYNAKHAQLESQLKAAADFERACQDNIGRLENEQVELPHKIDALGPKIDRAQEEFNIAQQRYSFALSQYDAWRNSDPTGVYHGASVQDSRTQRDRLERALKEVKDEEKRAQRRTDQIPKDIINERNKMAASADRQAKLREQLGTLEMSPLPTNP